MLQKLTRKVSRSCMQCLRSISFSSRDSLDDKRLLDQYTAKKPFKFVDNCVDILFNENDNTCRQSFYKMWKESIAPSSSYNWICVSSGTNIIFYSIQYNNNYLIYMRLFMLDVKQALLLKHNIDMYDFMKGAERVYMPVYEALISKDFQRYCLK